MLWSSNQSRKDERYVSLVEPNNNTALVSNQLLFNTTFSEDFTLDLKKEVKHSWCNLPLVLRAPALHVLDVSLHQHT